MHQINAKYSANITEFKKNPSAILHTILEVKQLLFLTITNQKLHRITRNI